MEHGGVCRRHPAVDTAALLDAAAARPTARRSSPRVRRGPCPTWCGTSARSSTSGARSSASGMQDLAGYVRPARPDVRRGAVRRSPPPAPTGSSACCRAVDPATPVCTWASQQRRRVRRPADGPRRPPCTASTPSGRPGDDRRRRSRAGRRRHRRVPRTCSSPRGREAPPLDGSVHLHCTDVDGEWLVTAGADGAHAGDARARQGRRRHPRSGHDLLMVLWRTGRRSTPSTSSATAASPSASSPAPTSDDLRRGLSELVQAHLGDAVIGLLAQDQRGPLAGRQDVLAEVAAVDGTSRWPRPSPAPRRR